MASQDQQPASTVETPEVKVAESTKVEETVGEPVEPVATETTDDAEPDEDSYEDRADYKKALKEWTKKQTEKELREAHKKEVDGYYADLRKQRQQKRELKEQLMTLQSQIPQPKIQDIPKPDINQYDDPERYANDMVQYDRAVRKLEAHNAQQVQSNQRSEAETLDTIWKQNVAESGLMDIDQVVVHVEKTGLLNDFTPDARKAIVMSPAGPHVLKFLAMNPDIAEEISESPRPLAELKQLESMLIKSIYSKPVQASAPPQVSQPAPIVKTEPPKFVPPSIPKSGSSHTGAPKKLTNASNMEEYMRMRMTAKQNRKW